MRGGAPESAWAIVGECKKYWNGTMQGTSQPRLQREGEERCRCIPKNWEAFQRKRRGWREPHARKGRWPCGCETRWEHCIKTSSLPRSTQWKGSRPMRASRLAVVTVLQYAENLTARQAANAVRGRIDWNYSLGL